MIDVRGFNGGMNQDAAPELLPNGDYTYAMNISNGSEGITNLPGNRLPDGFPTHPNPGSEWVCGSFFDKVRQRIIYFTNHERGVHRIISYSVPDINNTDGTYTVLFEDQNGVFSDWYTSPYFDPALLIKDIKVVHREYEGDLYYFIDQRKRLLKFNYNTILKWKSGDNTLCAFGWTDANYNGTLFSDGTPIPHVTDPVEWAALTTPAWCHYNNDPANDVVYGKLYNWYAVNDPLFVPDGYRLPTDEDWENLITCLGGENIAGAKMKNAGISYWNSPNTGANNESLFNALPGGRRDGTGLFKDITKNAFFWSATEIDANTSYNLKLSYDDTIAAIGSYSKKEGNSVRLIKQ